MDFFASNDVQEHANRYHTAKCSTHRLGQEICGDLMKARNIAEFRVRSTAFLR